MKILFVCDVRPHGHDYGTDFLIQAAYALYGAGNVYEWPEKPNLHLSVWSGRDECQIDSDAWLPAKGHTAEQIRAMVSTGAFDLVIMTTAYGTPTAWNEVCAGALPQLTPIVGLHCDDELTDTRPLLRAFMDRPLSAYRHRESPPSGAYPLFLSQPLSRVREVRAKPHVRPLFYSAAAHGDDSPRARMAAALQREFPDAAVQTTPDQRGRLTPELYRERMWESDISVVWNSGPEFRVWDCNRIWESCALGCALVCERPLYEAPALVGVEWIDAPEEAPAAVRRLFALSRDELTDRQMTLQRSFMVHHSSDALLQRIVAAVRN